MNDRKNPRALERLRLFAVILSLLISFTACAQDQAVKSYDDAHSTVVLPVSSEVMSDAASSAGESSSGDESIISSAPEVSFAPSPIILDSAAAEAVKERLNAICKECGVVGLSMAVFKGQDLFFKHSYGYADKALRIAACENTKYRIASISKTVTGILAMQLIAEGRLSLDIGVSGYLGVDIDDPRYPNDKITLRQLMTHTSGITDSLAYIIAADSPGPLADLLSYGTIHSGTQPGTHYLYSNFGAGLMCGIIERATGKRFYDYADERLFIPLQMDAGFLRTRIDDTENIAVIYNQNAVSADVKRWGRVESAYDSIPLGQMYLIGQSDLIISAADLAAFAIALAGDGTYNSYEILPQEEVNEMNAVAFDDGVVKRGLALGMVEDLVHGRTLHGHVGQAYGMISAMYYDPADHTGVVFITNGCDVRKNRDDIYTIVDAIVNAAYAEFFDKGKNPGSTSLPEKIAPAAPATR